MKNLDAIRTRAQREFEAMAGLHPHAARTARLFAPLRIPDGEAESLAADLRTIHRAHRTLARNLKELSGPCSAHLQNLAHRLWRAGLAEKWERGGDRFFGMDLDGDETAYGRPDCLATETGLKLVETNFDTGIGVIDLCSDTLLLTLRCLRPDQDSRDFTTPVTALAAWFDARYGDEPTRVQWVSSPSRGRQIMCDAMVASLNSASRAVEHRMNHPNGATVPDLSEERRSVFHRSVSFNTILQNLGVYHELFRAHMVPDVHHAVPSGNAILASKAFLALCSSNSKARILLSDEELAAIDRRIPWTASVTELTDYEQRRVLEERERYVLKLCDSYRSLDVHFGMHASAEEWQRQFDRAVRESLSDEDVDGMPRHWILQEMVIAKKERVRELTSAGWQEREMALNVCPFVFGGRAGGFFVTEATTNPEAAANGGAMVVVPAMCAGQWDACFSDQADEYQTLHV